MKMIRRLLPVLLIVFTALPLHKADSSAPMPTPVLVRVVAHHALALGDNVGGARVTIRDVESGKMLAEGRQTGPSGDLKMIMQTPRLQNEPVYSVRDAASFKTELSLTKPTWVEITAEGPLEFPHAKRRASKVVLLYPGKAVTGDGIVLELDGLLVKIQEPTTERPLGIGDEGTLRTTVQLLCGCVVEPFGNWDSRKMDLYGELRLGEKVLQKIDLDYQGPNGLFKGNFTIPKSIKGEKKIRLRVIASDPEGVNVGFDEVTYPLVPWEQSRDATGQEIAPIKPPAP